MQRLEDSNDEGGRNCTPKVEAGQGVDEDYGHDEPGVDDQGDVDDDNEDHGQGVGGGGRPLSARRIKVESIEEDENVAAGDSVRKRPPHLEPKKSLQG